MQKTLESIKPMIFFESPTGTEVKIQFTNSYNFGTPCDSKVGCIFPHKCRHDGMTYKGDFSAGLLVKCEDYITKFKHSDVLTISFGQIPIMLMSQACYLRGCGPKELIRHKEEEIEQGGYFICSGMERLVGLQLVPKRNHPLGILNESFRHIQPGFTQMAISIRCVRGDQSMLSNKLYYLQTESPKFGFWVKGKELFFPVGLLLRALCRKERYDRVIGYLSSSTGGVPLKCGKAFFNILYEAKDLGDQNACLDKIGTTFQPFVDIFTPESYSSNTEIGKAVLKDYVLVHLITDDEKFNLLIFMLQKLLALVDGTVAPDNVNSLQNQEVILPGHLFTIYLKEKLEAWLHGLGLQLIEARQSDGHKKSGISFVRKLEQCLEQTSSLVGNALELLIETGALDSSSGLELPVREGLTLQMKRDNFLSFLSHFDAIHVDGSSEKLPPEALGEHFGLTNHMTIFRYISSFFDPTGKLRDFIQIRRSVRSILYEHHMTLISSGEKIACAPEYLYVLLDGQVLGSIPCRKIEEVIADLRELKISESSMVQLSESSMVPYDLEIGYMPLGMKGAYPGLYLCTCPSRLLRPIKTFHGSNCNVELVSLFEQRMGEEDLIGESHFYKLLQCKHIMENVVSRLPAKSVGILSCVSKELLSLISDSHIIQTHCSLADFAGFFLLDQQRAVYLPLDLTTEDEDHHLAAISDPSLSFLGLGDDFVELFFDCSCKGLVLCHHSHYRRNRQELYVCNPLIEDYSTFFGPRNVWFEYLSLAFDPFLCPDFKVVGITRQGDIQYKSMYIFSSETELWRPLIWHLEIEFQDILFNRSVFWNGFLVWLGCKDSILSLDVKTGQLKRLPSMPDFHHKYSMSEMCFVESNGRIYFVGNSIFGRLNFDILEMESDSSGWSLIYHVDLNILEDLEEDLTYWKRYLRLQLLFSPVYFLRGSSGSGGRNSDQLLLCTHEKIVSYHIQDRRFTTVCSDVSQAAGIFNNSSSIKYSWHQLHSHVHCLFSLNRQRSILGLSTFPYILGLAKKFKLVHQEKEKCKKC